MKTSYTLVSGVITLIALFVTVKTNAAFIIEPNGKASANYVAGTATTISTLAGAGTLLAPGLTLNAASVYGGEPYIYTYIPGVGGNNTIFGIGSILNSAAGLKASGLATAGAGIYNVYHTFPDTANASGQPTLYNLRVNGTSVATKSQDQNFTDVATGVGVGLWELIGQATLYSASDTLTLTVNTTTSAFVGSRTAGVLIDYVAAVPEPSNTVLICVGIGVFLVRRRR